MRAHGKLLCLTALCLALAGVLTCPATAAAHGYPPYQVPPQVPLPPTPEAATLLIGSSVSAQDGWIVAHLSGNPYQIGFQNGFLTAQSTHYWIFDDLGRVGGHARSTGETIARRYIWPLIPVRYQNELKGIADGLHDAGYARDTLWDVVAANAWADQEVYAKLLGKSTRQAMTLALATRLAGPHCSAFVATGDATADGQPVMGHNTWSAYHDNFMFNIMFFVHPDEGYDFAYQSAGGEIWSGQDWYENSAGVLLAETTIYDPVESARGLPIFVRARRAIQFDSTVAQVVKTFTYRSNGAYANEWLIADSSGEIASLQLGCRAYDLHRTHNGFFGSCNYTWGRNILAEAYGHPRAPGVESARWKRWRQLKHKFYGKIDVTVGRAMESDTYDVRLRMDHADDRTLCGEDENASGRSSRPYSGAWDWGAYDGKVTTEAMTVNGLQMWARWGHPNGDSFSADRFLKHNRHWARDWGPWAVFGLRTFSAQSTNAWTLLQQ